MQSSFHPEKSPAEIAVKFPIYAACALIGACPCKRLIADEGRRSGRHELGDEVRGRCLECGAELNVPLATERHSRLVVVGRAGQGIIEVDD